MGGLGVEPSPRREFAYLGGKPVAAKELSAPKAGAGSKARAGSAPVAPARPDLLGRLETQVSLLASRMTKRFVEELPAYRGLPQEQVEHEVREICAINVQFFIAGIRENRAPTPGELDALRSSSARRAEEGVPLGEVLAAYHVGAGVGWQAFVDEARPDEQDQLPELGRRLLAYMQTVTTVVADAYVEEHSSIDRDRRDARRRLTELLLSGDGGEARLDTAAALLARQAGVELASDYIIMELAVEPSRDERAQGVESAVAARRKLRRLLECAEREMGGHVLDLLDTSGGTLLLPAPDGDDPGEADEPLPETLLGRLTAAADAPLTAAVASRSSLAGLSEAADEARTVLDLVLRMGRGPGLHALADVALEYALSRPGLATRIVADLLSDEVGSPWLLETLEAWVAHDFDRRATAGQLHIHPNTLDYRLQRVGQLTGADPSTARGLQLLTAALTARRLLPDHERE